MTVEELSPEARAWYEATLAYVIPNRKALMDMNPFRSSAMNDDGEQAG